MIKKIVIICLMICLFLDLGVVGYDDSGSLAGGGCATPKGKRAGGNQEMSFPASYIAVYTAVMKTLPDYGFTAVTPTKDAVVINTNWLAITEGQLGAEYSIGVPRKVSIYLMKVNDSQTDVRIVISRRNANNESYNDNKDNALSRSIFKTLNEYMGGRTGTK